MLVVFREISRKLSLRFMNRILACVFLSIGSVLVIYSLNVLPSVSRAFSRLLSGGSPDQALWFLLAGLAAIVIGVVRLLIAPIGRPRASSRGGRQR